MARSDAWGASEGTTRRGFLKASASVASATTLGVLNIGAYAGGSDVIRLGMIGCGGRNTGAADQAMTADKGVRLVAMCDIFMDRIKVVRETLKKGKPEQVTADDDHCFAGFDGYKRVIEASDVVVIANAAKFHPLHALTAIKAGKHVFVEKPHGIDPLGMKVMKQAADLAKDKACAWSPACTAAIIRVTPRRSSASTTVRSATWSPSRKISSAVPTV
ncbi:MAG TPA: Gfo/Idh/MocA family oxidoreductase [Sedimentisphaerales bacterium]|nr:Gfo/Idh/MocA family oxidoreductase [Sedimentisphaerales bacterium]